MEPAITGALITTIGSAAAGTASNASVGKMNRKSRQHAWDMYHTTRRDALSDMHFQNEYNSPAAQMKRLKAAGLNPNLVYGHGQATEQAATARSAQSPSAEFQPANWDTVGQSAGRAIDSYYDTKMKQAQTNNIEETNKVIVLEAALKAAQIRQTIESTAQTTQNTEMSRFNLELAKKNEVAYLQKAEEEVRNLQISRAATEKGMLKTDAEIKKIGADTKYTLDQNERAAAMNSAMLQKNLEEVLQIRMGRARTSEEIHNLQQQRDQVIRDITIKDLDILLKQKGIQPNDPAYARIVARLLQGKDATEIMNDIKKGLGEHHQKVKKNLYRGIFPFAGFK